MRESTFAKNEKQGMKMTQKKQILVIEDNEINRTILCAILADEYEVLEAENGQAALDILEDHKDEVALIILDVSMPVMDGYTFLNIAQKDAKLSLIPVIVMTQENSEAEEISALELGATDFLPKPYRPRVIRHRVANLIKLRETAAMVNQFQYDRLTGLYTKEFFIEKSESVWMKIRKKSIRFCAVIWRISNCTMIRSDEKPGIGNSIVRSCRRIYP